MPKYLVDANLSPGVARFLVDQKGHDAISLMTLGLNQIPDSEVVEMAKRDDRIIVTLDNGFGATYFKREPAQFGAIILRLSDQSTRSVIAALERFFT